MTKKFSKYHVAIAIKKVTNIMNSNDNSDNTNNNNNNSTVRVLESPREWSPRPAFPCMNWLALM